MTNDIRAALERLVELSKQHAIARVWDGAFFEARAALAKQPVLEGPSLDDVDELCAEFGFHLPDDEGRVCSKEVLRDMITAVLARWGHPTALLAPDRTQPNQEDSNG